MTASSSPTRQSPVTVLLGIGSITNDCDALGIGSFATTTAALRFGRLVDDENIPGTMNVGHASPTILEAVLFLVALGGLIDKPTFITMVVMSGVGAWFGAGIVANWPRQKIQRAMAIALVVTAGFMVMRLTASLSLSEGTIDLNGIALAIGVLASLIIGSLTSLGIGNYAPTMAITYFLGMNQKAVFPNHCRGLDQRRRKSARLPGRHGFLFDRKNAAYCDPQNGNAPLCRGLSLGACLEHILSRKQGCAVRGSHRANRAVVTGKKSRSTTPHCERGWPGITMPIIW